MCKAKADGGKRCTCPAPVRRAKSRAKYAADKLAAPVEGAPKPSGQLTEEEMTERYSYQLRAMAEVWADRDPAYAKELRDAADAQQMMEGLRGDTYVQPDDNYGGEDGEAATDKGLKSLWCVDQEFLVYKNKRTVVDEDGNPVRWDHEGWEQYEHTVRMRSEDGENWQTVGEGTLHNPETGQWMAYRFHDDGKGKVWTGDGKIAGTLDEAASHLTDAERAELGLPANRPAPVETVEVPKTKQADLMKDLRRQLVGDTAKPDAGLEFAAKMQAMRLEAVARGASTDHKWSMTNRLMTQMEAARRGVNIAGWMGGERQWEAQGRVLKPGARPYEIWAPVIKSAKSKVEDEDDETNGRAAGAAEDETPKGRRFSKKTADGKEMVGFRLVKVYDWTQTVRSDGQPDPDWKANVPGGNPELLERLKASSPFPIEYDHSGNTTGHAHGWTDGRKIVLDPNKSVGSQISTLAHEMAHAELDHVGRIQRGEMTREQAEQEAGLSQYLFVRSLDLGEDTDKAVTEGASSYLRNWTREDGKPVAGHKQRWKMLQDRVAPASDASHRILTRLLGLGEQESAGQVQQAA